MHWHLRLSGCKAWSPTKARGSAADGLVIPPVFKEDRVLRCFGSFDSENNRRSMFKFLTSLTWLQPFLAVCSLLALNGCATTEYTTYYAMFEAENSAGDWRQFRLHWQTVHREGWGGDSENVLPVVLEAQCSHRKLYFYDQSFHRNRQCGMRFGGDGAE